MVDSFRTALCYPWGAPTIRGEAQTILADLALGRPHEAEVLEWIGNLSRSSPTLIKRMEKLALVKGISQTHKTLGEFLEQHLASMKPLVKPNTHIFYSQTIRCLVGHFGFSTALQLIGPQEAEGFRTFLMNSEKDIGQGKLSPATINRRVGAARTLFAAAVKLKIISENPFDDVRKGEQTNKSRQFYVDHETTQRALAACPDIHWRLIVALARYGGVRCPSEIIPLKWTDVDFGAKRILIHSPKTERHKGGDTRMIPLFPELEPMLLEAFELAQEGEEFVVSRYRKAGANLRTQFKKILGRAGIKPWPKLWQNLRSSRETELMEDFSTHVVCSWIGNTPTIAKKHYLQVRDTDFLRAVQPKAQRIAQQQTAVLAVNGENQQEPLRGGLCVSAGKCLSLPANLPSSLLPFLPEMGRAGIEPATQGFSVLCSTN